MKIIDKGYRIELLNMWVYSISKKYAAYLESSYLLLLACLVDNVVLKYSNTSKRELFVMLVEESFKKKGVL